MRDNRGDRGDRGDRRGGHGGHRSFHGGGGRRFSGPREKHDAVCSDCGQACTVPFKPDENRPVYCSACFQNHKSDRGDRSGSGRRDFGKREERSDSSSGSEDDSSDSEEPSEESEDSTEESEESDDSDDDSLKGE